MEYGFAIETCVISFVIFFMSELEVVRRGAGVGCRLHVRFEKYTYFKSQGETLQPPVGRRLSLLQRGKKEIIIQLR